MDIRQDQAAPGTAGATHHPTQVSPAGMPFLRAAAGPALIVVAVLVVLHGFWLQARLTGQQVDLLSWWLPRWCAMGKAVASGHIPTWLPNQFGGVPFASDPQSGWLYIPVMALFGALPCTLAFGWFITLQPILAGLGMYAFFRHEGTGRPSATVGGLTLALSIAGSAVVLSMPFSGTLAWTGVSLAAVSGFLHARTPASRVGWLIFSGFAWSQIAAAHLTDGLLIGTMTIALYVAARLIAQIRAGERSWGSAGVSVAGLAVALPVLAAAVLLPRLALLPRTSIGHGYVALGALTQQLSNLRGVAPSALYPLYIHGVGPWWGTAFARAPGGYVGALAILLVPIAFASRRWGLPATAFAFAGFVGWVLNLNRLIAAGPVRKFALAHGLGALWLRSPYRFRYLLLLAFAALAGYGLQAWLDWGRARGRDALVRRAAWLVPGVVVFVVAPIVAGAHVSSYVLFVAGAAVAVPLLLLAAAGRGWAAPALAGALAVELVIGGLAGQGGPVPQQAADVLQPPAVSGLAHAFPTFHAPYIDPGRYTTPGPIGRALVTARGDFGRFVSFAPKIARESPRGFLFHQDPGVWPSYANGRATLLGLWDVQGYSPVQLFRYWQLIRKVDTFSPIYYNSATLQSIPPEVLKLFGVQWIVQPSNLTAPADATLTTTTEGNWSLYRLADAQPRASVVGRWVILPPGRALDAVLRPGFDSSTSAVVERPVTVDDHPISPPQSTPSVGLAPVVGSTQPLVGTASYSEPSPEHEQIRVIAGASSLLVIRNPWDSNWHATVDGKPAPVQTANFLMQGVGVPAGMHTVDLYYRDTAIGTGLWISAAGYLVLFGLMLGLWLRDRRRRGRTPPTSEPASDAVAA